MVLNLAAGLLFIAAAVAVVLLVQHQMREQARTEAVAKAELMLDRNLAAHWYFTHELKPRVAELAAKAGCKDDFDPVWMSSTYAVRQIESHVRAMCVNVEHHPNYSYKEAAVGARNPDNEADEYEKAFLTACNQDANLPPGVSVREIDGVAHLVMLRRGAVMERSCLRCHGSPSSAPAGLEGYSGGRGFGRKEGEVVSGISIRMPLSEAYAAADVFSWRLSGLLVVVLVGLFAAQFLLSRYVLLRPLGQIREQAGRIAAGSDHLGERVPVPATRELGELARAFNAMSASVRDRHDQLETTIQARTAELRQTNERLQREVDQRREAQRELEQSRRLLRTAIDALPDAMLVLDRDRRIVLANEAACRTVGGRDPVAEGMDPALILGEPAGGSETKGQARPFRRAQDSGKPVRAVDRYVDRQGRQTYAEVTAAPVLDESGQVERVVVMHRDVTRHMRSDEALRQSEERFRHTFEQAAVGVAHVSPRGDLLRVNERFCQILGYDHGQMRARTVRDITFPDDLEADLERLRDIWSGRIETYATEKRYVRGDGTLIWANVTISLVRKDDGKPEYFIAVVEDITQRKEAEEGVRRLNAELERRVAEQTTDLRKAIRDLRHEARQRSRAEEALVERSRALDAFFRHSITPLVILDREFNFIRVNEAYAKAYARDVSEYPGRNHFEMYPSDAKATFEEVVRTRKPFAALAHPFAFPDHPDWGTTYWDWTLVPLTGDDGEVESLVFSLKDVTESVRAHEQLKALNATLADRARQLRALALELTRSEHRQRRRLAQMLHDHLQQMLVGARMSLSMARRRTDSEALAKSLDDADALLGESIEASRTLTVELSPPILHDAGLVPALDWLGRWMGERHGLTVDVQGEEGPEPDSEDVRVLIFHAVRELLFNVVKHAGVRQARVTVQREQGWMHVSVIDEGPGFDPDKTNAGRGGLKAFGLFSIRERLEAIGGRLEVVAEPGAGTCVTLVTPLSLSPGGETDREGVESAGGVREDTPGVDARVGEGQAIRVLIADDHEVVRDALAVLLEQEPGIEVVAQAGDGKETIALVRRYQPDVVIMDVNMPVVDGVEATRQIVREMPRTRVIALTTYEEEDMAARMREAGASAYLTKGGPADWLIAAIRAAAPAAQSDRKNA